jgi:hypothetical protein
MLDPAFISLVYAQLAAMAFGASPSPHIPFLSLFSELPNKVALERGQRYLVKKVSEWAQHLAPSGVLTSRGKTLSLDKRDLKWQFLSRRQRKQLQRPLPTPQQA